MEVGAGPGIGDAGDLGQGPEHGGTESESGGMIGTSPGAGPGMGNAMSVEAFSKAISKALGQTRTEQEREMDDAYYGGTISQSQLDDPSDDSPAYDPDAVNRQVYGAPQALDDPQGTQEGLNAAIAANTANFNPSYNEREVNKQVYGETDVVHNVPKGARGFEVVTETEKTALPYSQMDQEERRNFYGKLNQIRQATRERQTPFGKAVHAAFSTALGFSTVNNIGKAVKAALDHLGFNVNPNEVEQAARHAFEVSKVGPYGNRPDSFIEEFLNNIPASSYDEPWMKGLNERQIQYYLDRPSELEWVRNLYNQMNPSGGMGQ